MSTAKNFNHFLSTNQMIFNKENDCQGNSNPYDKSILYVLDLKNNSESIFKNAIKRIENNEKSELCDIFNSQGSDKAAWHNYSQIYYELLKDFKNNIINFYEVGIGTPNQDVPSRMGEGYHQGSSLRGWRIFFGNQNMIIHGADVDPRVIFQAPGISTSYINSLSPNSIHN